MGKAENGEIREVTANIWEDRKHHLWFPISFTKYTVGNGRLYVNSGFLLSLIHISTCDNINSSKNCHEDNAYRIINMKCHSK